MRKWIFLLSALLVWCQSLAAQDLVSCTQLLEDAREAYAAGMVELVPELLVPCIESGNLSGTPKQDAYKLVISAYLFDYLPEEADSMMNQFVDDFPDYRALAADPAEFKLLLDTHLRARGIDPDAVVAVEDDGRDRPGDQGTQPVDTRPVIQRPPFIYSNAIGFQLGLNAGIPQVIERYSIGDPTLDDGKFEISPGFELGVDMNLLLNPSIEISFGMHYNRTGFRYTAAPLSFATYDYNEYQHHLQIPASVFFRLNPQGPRTSVYLRIGIVPDYLVAASGAGTRSYSEQLRDVVVEKTAITDARARLNLYGMAGTGIRIPLDRGFIFFEARFTSGLFLINREENRYEDQDLIWLIYHVDSDLMLHQLSLSAGMAWNL